MLVFATVALIVNRQLVSSILRVVPFVTVAADDVNGQIESIVLALVVDARVRVALVAMREGRCSLHPLVDLLWRFRIIDRLLTGGHIQVVQAMEIANIRVVWRQNVTLTAADLRWSQVLRTALDAVVVATAMDVGGADVLIVHRDDVPMVTTDIAFLVLKTAVIVLSVTGTVNARELLHIGILRRPVVLEDCLHVLLVAVRARVIALPHLSLNSVRAFDAKPLIVRRDEIEAELTGFDELDVVVVLRIDLLLAGHHSSLIVHRIVALARVVRTHGA
jgi:hypothetical protein